MFYVKVGSTLTLNKKGVIINQTIGLHDASQKLEHKNSPSYWQRQILQIRFISSPGNTYFCFSYRNKLSILALVQMLLNENR